MEGYLTYPHNNEKKCNYEIKSIKIAVFLSFFLGLLGADMFYLGYNIRGFVKFTLPILFLTMALIYRNRIENKLIYYSSIIVPIGLLLFSWIFDILMISSAYIRDSNEIELIK
jgi:TM2 domain-containing membrane protein YozV